MSVQQIHPAPRHSPHLVVTVDHVEVVLALALFNGFTESLNLLTRHAAPTDGVYPPQSAKAAAARFALSGADLPVLVLPAGMLGNLNPGSEPDLSLEQLDSIVLALLVLAHGPIVGRNLWRRTSASRIEIIEQLCKRSGQAGADVETRRGFNHCAPD